MSVRLSVRMTRLDFLDFRLPPRSSRELRSSGSLLSEWWQFMALFLDYLTLDVTDRLSRNANTELPLYAAYFPEERRSGMFHLKG